MNIRKTSDPADADWLTLRAEFFPEDHPGEHQKFLAAMANGPAAFTAFVAKDEHGVALGFAEVAVRREYVNGCRHQPAPPPQPHPRPAAHPRCGLQASTP